MLHVSSICYCLRHRTTLRFDFLHSLMVCRHCSDFRYTESRNFRIQLCLRINTKPNGKQKWFEDRRYFFWLVTSLPLFLKSIAVPIDHKRVNIIETLLFWTHVCFFNGHFNINKYQRRAVNVNKIMLWWLRFVKVVVPCCLCRHRN